MSPKTDQLQIRISPRQKAMLKRRARAAGVDVSTYVLMRALPPEADRFTAVLRAMRSEAEPRYALAELNDVLSASSALEFGDAVRDADLHGLSPYLQNYIAAMVEQAAHQKGMSPPEWTRDVAPLTTPHFADSPASLRPHLLRAAPVPFKRRNLFVDSGVGDRV